MHSLDCKTRNQKDKRLAIKFFRKPIDLSKHVSLCNWYSLGSTLTLFCFCLLKEAGLFRKTLTISMRKARTLLSAKPG